jgi:hypothetical protein
VSIVAKKVTEISKSDPSLGELSLEVLEGLVVK